MCVCVCVLLTSFLFVFHSFPGFVQINFRAPVTKILIFAPFRANRDAPECPRLLVFSSLVLVFSKNIRKNINLPELFSPCEASTEPSVEQMMV